MKLTKDDLLDIMTNASYRLHSEIRHSFNDGTLNQYLERIGMEDLIPKDEQQSLFESFPYGKVVIVGATKLKPRIIYGILKEFGISKEQVELQLGYEEAKTMTFDKYRYKPEYRLLLFGPVPHSGTAKGKSSSIITELEGRDGYPKIIRLTDDHQLKITKTNLKKAIRQELEAGYLEAS